MRLSGDTSAHLRPGQFVNIALAGRFLRRPISVSSYDAEGLNIVYKIVGEGTADLAGMKPEEELDLLSGLGNGFDYSVATNRPLLVGGGVGVAPLYGLAMTIKRENPKAQIKVILGFNSADEVFFEEEFKALGAEVLVSTLDGSAGSKAFASDLMKGLDYGYIYACGPMPMLRAVNAAANSGGQFSLEERMGCGFGACMGCSCKTLLGNKKVCTDGPVFAMGEIIW